MNFTKEQIKDLVRMAKKGCPQGYCFNCSLQGSNPLHVCDFRAEYKYMYSDYNNTTLTEVARKILRTLL